MKILSRCMKSPPPKCWRQNEWRALVRTLVVGECVDLKVDDMNVARKLLLRNGHDLGFKLTTRKSDHASLEVYRVA